MKVDLLGKIYITGGKDEIVKKPEKLKLGGQLENISVLFCNLASLHYSF